MNNNPRSEKLTFSFRELIDKYKIEIPIIQRDYAQGREGKEELRKDFLGALHSAITEEKLLELDFVYGDVKKGTLLQPLDGQQRLTTLFLLHWYIATKEKKLDDGVKGLLSKFTYETRTSSREFCAELVNKGIDFNNLLETDYRDKEKRRPKNNQLSKTIEDTSWFFLSWKKDPTIKSMLTMLDAIHKKFHNENNDLWDKLKNISFHFVELKGFGLSDDLYIKMNARGKALTEFENFKAKFEQYIERKGWEKSLNLTETFAHKIDTVWTDLFWKNRGDKNIFDKQILNFFRTMAVISYSLTGDIKNNCFEVNIKLLRDNSKAISFSKYIELGCFNEDYLKLIKTVLDKISDKNGLKKFLSDSSYINEKKIFNKAIENKLSYADLVVMFAFYQYLALEENIESQKITSWMRIIRNLVEGARAYLFNNSFEYATALRSVHKLLEHRNVILEYFSDTNTQKISLSGFTGEQINEEVEKAKLILQSNEWRNAILKIENHGYFKGQIGFLLDWSKNGNGEPNLDLFKNYAEKVSGIFTDTGLNKFDGFLFERALLATGDYLLKKGRNHSFLIDFDRDISWKRLLRDKSVKRDFLKELVAKITIQTLKEDLQNCVDEFSDVDNWRYHFIKQPEIISSSGSNKLIRRNNKKDILVLGSTTTSGFHTNYYCFSLYLEVEKMVADNKTVKIVDHLWQRSVKYQKSFTVTMDDIDYAISFINGKYEIESNSLDGTASPPEQYDKQSDVCDFLRGQIFKA